MFLAYPYGTGHRGTAYLSPRYLKQEELARSRSNPEGVGARSSHNTFMTALTEQGVPGVILYAGLLLWILRTTRATARAAADAADGPRLQLAATAATLVVVLAAGMFTDYFKAEVFVWGIALLATLHALLVPRAAAATVPDRPLPAVPGAPRPAGPRPAGPRP
jgi:O-antigen ligase